MNGLYQAIMQKHIHTFGYRLTRDVTSLDMSLINCGLYNRNVLIVFVRQEFVFDALS